MPHEQGKVSIYVCGPTVYNLIHIGNARPMIIFDTVRRYMEHKGWQVNYVSNFTDVDDKIIKKAQEEGVESSVISERYIEECKKDMKALNVKTATVHPKATEEIDGMQQMIKTLLENGNAYVAKDGTVYLRQEVSAITANCRIKTWMTYGAETAPCSYPVKTRKKTRWISCSGSRRKRESLFGNRPGVKGARAGISSVPS